MSLPLAWVERIFEKLIVTYGSTFLARWKDVDIGMVKTDWCHELSSYERAPHAIAFALANLPERPPSVIEFKSLCRQAPTPETPMLPLPPANPERMKAELEKLAPLRHASPDASSLGHRGEWAYRILARHKGGEQMSPAALQMAREGLRNLGLPYDHQ